MSISETQIIGMVKMALPNDIFTPNTEHTQDLKMQFISEIQLWQIPPIVEV